MITTVYALVEETVEYCHNYEGVFATVSAASKRVREKEEWRESMNESTPINWRYKKLENIYIYGDYSYGDYYVLIPVELNVKEN